MLHASLRGLARAFVTFVAVALGWAAPFAQAAPPLQYYATDIAASPLRAPVEPAFDLTSAFTLEAWIYLTGNQPRSWIMGKATPINGGAGGQMLNFGLQLDDAGTNLRFVSAAVFLSAPNPLPMRTWTHVAVTVDGSITRLLINGAVVATRENSPAIAPAAATPFGVGSTFDANGQGAPGEADILMARQLRVWSVARTAAQIAAAMSETLPGTPVGLVALWSLDESGGLTARDISGAGRHLTKNVAIGTRRLSVLEAGPFFAPTTLTVGTTLLPDPSAIELIDFDNDGDLDLIVMQVKQPPTFPGTERRVLAFRNNNGNFVEATDAVLGTIMLVGPRASWAADFNGDGRSDLFIAETGTDTFPYPGDQSRLFIQSADGRLIDETATRLPARISYTHDMAAADVDGDGDLDIVMGNYIKDSPRIYLNNGSGIFSDPGDRMPADVASGWTENPSAGFIDVNRDGRPDLVLGGNYYALNGPNSTRPNLLLMNDGTGRFVRDPAFTIPPKLHGIEGVTVKIVSADLNGDGAPDLLLSTDSGAIVPGLQLLLHDGNGGLRDATAQLNFNYSSQDQWIVDLKVLDLNGDGLPDIVVRTNSSNYSPLNYNRSILLNRGNATFVDASEAFIASTHGGMRVGDFDRDGRPDVVTLYHDRLITHRSTQSLPVALFNPVAPVFTIQPASQTATAGNMVQLIATATGAPTPTLQWQRNGVPIPDAVNPILTLPQTTWSQGGVYTAVATSAAGTTPSTAATLTVNAPPAILTPPVSQTVTAGDSVSFTVVATDTPAPTYQWRRNGDPLPNATAATLTLTNVQAANAGDYDVVVTNSLGLVTSTVAQLTVTPLPAFTAWLSARFSVSERNDPQRGTPAADPDRDGLSNLLEYALGREPLAADNTSPLVVVATANDWTCTFTRPADRADLVYTVEFSTNLTTWTTTGVVLEKITSGPTETWRANYPRDTAPTAFFRLRAALP